MIAKNKNYLQKVHLIPKLLKTLCDILLLYYNASFCVNCGYPKALERLLGWRKWLILTLLPILDWSHKGWVLQIANVPLQISFKYSEPFLAFIVNFWPKTIYMRQHFLFCFEGVSHTREITEPFRKIKAGINDLR